MAFQFIIQIEGISKPPVWRKVIVPKYFTFHQLHQVIQAAFGWGDEHLYQFSPTGWGSVPRISLVMEDDFEKPEMDTMQTKLSDIFRTEKQTFVYIYDFGDDWTHKITLEKITDDTFLKVSCIGGKGACPPEDCGGIGGYSFLREVIADPKHPEHIGIMEWLELEEGDTWEDVFAFDLEEANEAVREV